MRHRSNYDWMLFLTSPMAFVRARTHAWLRAYQVNALISMDHVWSLYNYIIVVFLIYAGWRSFGLWIGGRRVCGVWKWIGEKNETIKYFDWYKDQPDPKLKKCPHVCIKVFGALFGTNESKDPSWETRICDWYYPFACERPPSYRDGRLHLYRHFLKGAFGPWIASVHYNCFISSSLTFLEFNVFF